jgi:hypothetical protein
MQKLTLKSFLEDKQGRTYRDVAQNPDLNWDKWLRWFNDDQRLERMEIAEKHFGMPALAGVLKEFESEDFVQKYFGFHNLKETKRVKQALGVIARIYMEAKGWSKSGTPGPMGRRNPNYQGHGDHNTARSFSRYILRSEHYKK